MRNFSFADQILTDYDPPIVIAEIGINHNGSFDEAIHLVDSAISAGAKFVKLQTHIASAEMSQEAKSIVPQHTEEDIFSIIQSCELTYDEEQKISDHIKSKDCSFISTPFSLDAVDRVASHDPPFFKIGSGEFSNLPLLSKCLRYGKPMVLSTGMHTLPQIERVAKFLDSHNAEYAFLHCTNLYPTPDKYVRLQCITQMREKFPNIIIGLSDHTTSNLACLGAVALGAGILERHFTDSKLRQGPDILNSMTPQELSELIEGSQTLSQQRWGNKNELLSAEDDTRAFALASIVASAYIPQNTIFTTKNITVKRPGTGDFNANQLDLILGRKSTRDIPIDTQISFGDLQ